MVKSKKDNKMLWIILAIILFLIIYQTTNLIPVTTKDKINISITHFKNLISGGGGSSVSAAVVNKGASLKPILVDENGNKIGDVGVQDGGTFSIISKSGSTGFNVISPDSCVSSCTFLAFNTFLDNSEGDSEITVSAISGSNPCTTPGSATCTTIASNNVLGTVGTGANNWKGGLNSSAGGVWAGSIPQTIAKGARYPPASTISTTPLSLDLIAYGESVDFTMSVTGTYTDSQGDQQPLTGKLGKTSLLINKQLCSDNTATDTNSLDADALTYCSTNKPKYCRTDAYGVPQLFDHAGASTGFVGCGCPAGQHAVGQSCVVDGGCTTGTCIAGTVNYCVNGATGTIETRCQQCTGGILNNIQSYCPLDANLQQANACNPATSGVVSQCVYPGASGSGFTVSIASSSFTPINPCGDGVKNGGEVCDGSDLGGASCISLGFAGGTLSCNGACNGYVTTSCTSNYVKFRTLFSTISGAANADEIAFMPTPSTQCTTPPATLSKAGEYGTGGGASGTSNCVTKMASLSATKLLDITNGAISIFRSASYPTGTINKAFWADDTVGTYYVCGDDADSIGYAYIAFKTSISTSAVSNSINSLDSAKEQAC